MTRSQTYAFERSKDLNKPIVLFDEAEVALFMGDLSLFPVVSGPIVKGWELVRLIVLTKFSLQPTEGEVLSLVTNPDVDYGFAIVAGAGKTLLGVFERAVVPANSPQRRLPRPSLSDWPQPGQHLRHA